MHNLYAIFAKILDICKEMAGNSVNEHGNVPRRGVVSGFSDIEVMALNITSEATGLDSESCLFAGSRKRIETLFSQLCDRFMITRNYAKDTERLFTRIIGRISALTILQFINYKNNRPLGRVKYALI